MTHFATVLLVDPRGWVLLQERDEHAPVDPDRWGLVGGHVEDGEEVEEAVHRELAEETGLTTGPGEATPGLTYWRTFTVHGEDEMTVYAGATTVTDDDVVCGEGRQIVFVEPGVATGLHLTRAAEVVVPEFLRSPRYASLLA